MASDLNDSIIDFDLSYLDQTSNINTSVSKFEKQRKAVTIAKKKIVATDSLIKKYYARREELDWTEKSLVQSKEECKQVCLEYGKTLELCLKLEKDNKSQQETIQTIEDQKLVAETQSKSMQVYADQLQQLVQENQEQIKRLNKENGDLKKSAKEEEKLVFSLKQENENLLKHIRLAKDIVFGKKKINHHYKSLLQKYVSESDEDDKSGNDSDCSDGPLSPHFADDIEIHTRLLDKDFTSEKLSISNKNGKTMFKKDFDNDSNCSNEVVSVDTGRGSSLALTDSDKCFNSPEYFMNDSPHNIELLKRKNKTNVSTSPILFDIISTESKPTFKDCSTSPVMFDKSKKAITISTSTSPVKQATRETATSPILIELTKTPTPRTSEVHVLECLEVNNSKTIIEDNNDYEIENIFNKVRMNHRLITPIPSTPSKSKEIRDSSNESLKNYNKGYVCEEAAKVHEENLILQANFAELTKELINIKSMVSNYQRDIRQDNLDCKDKKVVLKKIRRLFETSDDDQTLHHSDDYTEGVPEEDLIRPEDLFFETQSISKNTVACDDMLICSKQTEEPDSIPPFVEYFEPDNSLEETSHCEAVIDSSFEDCESSNIITEISLSEEKMTEHISSIMESTEIELIENSDSALPETDNVELNNSLIEGNCSESVMNSSYEDCENQTIKSPLQEKGIEKLKRNRRLTKLEKLRKKMLPKQKIRKDILPIKKPRVNLKPLKTVKSCKKNYTDTDTAATLNDKTVYERALQVMAEVKSKQNVESNNNKVCTRPCDNKVKNNLKRVLRSPKQFETNAPIIDMIDNEERKSETTPPRSVNSNKKTNKLSRDLCSLVVAETTNNKEHSTPERCTPKKSEISTVKSVRNNIISRLEIEPSIPLAVPTEMEVHNKDDNKSPQTPRTRLKRASTDKPEIQPKRLLRSASIQKSPKSLKEDKRESSQCLNEKNKTKSNNEVTANIGKVEQHLDKVNYSDLDIFTESSKENGDRLQVRETSQIDYKVDSSLSSKQSVLCSMLQKYGRKKVKGFSKKVPENISKNICKKLDENITRISELPSNETKEAMDSLVKYIEKLKLKHFLSGLILYLQDPIRKAELLSKSYCAPAPAMTKAEQIILYIVIQLKCLWPNVDIIEEILASIEYTLFRLSNTPNFDTIESMSHLYAILCRYARAKSRLRIFILDALYCIQFKSIPLIKQCLEVWSHVIPLAHLGLAKSPLVTCLVYLLHFYKCEDRFNRVQDLRSILNRKYSYQMSEWNDPKIIETLRSAICELKDIPVERKMLRLAIIILAKRRGTQWCQCQIIKNLLNPLIEKKEIPDHVKRFCISMLGPLLKPYPADMKVHCVIIMNKLADMLLKDPTEKMQEVIYTSLILLSKHDQNRVIRTLLDWKPQSVSSEMESLLRDYVQEKPINVWKTILSHKSLA